MLSDFSQRSTDIEIMDMALTDFAEFDECMRHIEVINRLSLGYRPVLFWLEQFLPSVLPGHPLTIVDIGCGRGEMLRQIWKWANKKKIEVHLTGIDINPWAIASARKSTPDHMPIHYKTSNICGIKMAENADIIISTHFTHHLENDELIRFLQWMDTHAAQGWVINDLHRHKIPYFFIKYILSFFPLNKMARHDGPVSVARAFTLDEWKNLLRQADIMPSETAIRWFFPFRYGIARWKDQPV